MQIELEDDEVQRAAFLPWLMQRPLVFRLYLAAMLCSGALVLYLYDRATRRVHKSPSD